MSILGCNEIFVIMRVVHLEYPLLSFSGLAYFECLDEIWMIDYGL